MKIEEITGEALKEVPLTKFLREVFPIKTVRALHENRGGFGYGLVKISSDGGDTFHGRVGTVSSNKLSLKTFSSNTYWCDFRAYTSRKLSITEIVDYRAIVISLDFGEDDKTTDEKRKNIFSMINNKDNNKGKAYVKPTYVLVCGQEMRLMYLFDNRVSKYDKFDAFLFQLYISLCDFFGTNPEGFDAYTLLPESSINGNHCYAYRYGKPVKIEDLAEMTGIQHPKIKDRANKGDHHVFRNVYEGWVHKMSDESYVFTKESAEALWEIGQRADDVTDDMIREDIRTLVSGSSADIFGDSGCIPSFGTRKYRHASYGYLKKLAGIDFVHPVHTPRVNYRQEVLDWMNKHPGAKKSQCSDELGVPYHTVRRILLANKDATAELPFDE